MVKKVFLIILMVLSLNADNTDYSIYNLNCVQCHSQLPVSIDKYFYKYLLKYSSERDVKKAMFDYLKNPTSEKTVMTESFITRFGVKKKTNLNDSKLRNAIDGYWDKYKIFGKLK